MAREHQNSLHMAAPDFGSDDMTFTAADGDMITCSYYGGGSLGARHR